MGPTNNFYHLHFIKNNLTIIILLKSDVDPLKNGVLRAPPMVNSPNCYFVGPIIPHHFEATLYFTLQWWTLK